MKILVLGYGSSGKAAELLAKSLGNEVEVREDGRRGLEAESESAVVSPGIPLTSPLVAECRAHGIPLKSELQFGCEELRRLGWRLLAVTGSKGKSSVVKLVAEALDGVPCGNYGRPVCDVAVQARRGLEAAAPVGGATSTGAAAPRPRHSWAVVEVSSFQLETTNLPPDTFEAAAVLNLQEDHLDRHGSVDVYHGLKRKLLGMTRHPIVMTDALRARANLLAGSYFDNEILRENGLYAIGLLKTAGLDDERIAAAFRDFVPLPHRMNVVAEIGGVRYVDDSKATSLAALAAGVRMAAGTVRLIAGGLPKGDDPKSVLPTLTERVKKVYLIGQSAATFSEAWKDAVDCEICGTLERAVESARRDAEAGETVLLSPGTASFDQFNSFGERGDVFAGLVKKERNEK